MSRVNNRREVVRVAHELHRRGWVANHDGNVTTRINDQRYLVTPTATSKAAIKENMLLEVDPQGRRVSGTHRPFGELKIHLAVYHSRGDVGAIVHAHPPNATAIACAGQNIIETPFIPEAVVSLGPRIPLLPNSSPETVSRAAHEVDAVLLQHHGVFTWGPTLDLALCRLELVEHLATIAIKAIPMGGHRSLTQAQINPLLEKRASASLGSAADQAIALGKKYSTSKTVVACAPAPHSLVKTKAPQSNLNAIIREEIKEVLNQNANPNIDGNSDNCQWAGYRKKRMTSSDTRRF